MKTISCLLKGQNHEIFDSWFFFHQLTPPRALIHGLKLLIFGAVFAEKIDNIPITISPRGVIDPAEIGF
jgi:hypothetical protein